MSRCERRLASLPDLANHTARFAHRKHAIGDVSRDHGGHEAKLAPALAKVKIGETVAVTIASPATAPAADRDRVWTHTLHHPDAAFLRLHIRQLRLGPNDVLRLLDGEGREIAAYSGESKRRNDFWAAVADGDPVTLELTRGETGRGLGGHRPIWLRAHRHHSGHFIQGSSRSW